MCTIRVYEESMYEDLLEFLVACFPETGRTLELDGRHAIYKDIPNNYDVFWCLLDKDKIIGTAAIRRLSEKNCELKTLFIYQSYYGRGLGFQLLSNAIRTAKVKGYENLYLDSLKDSKRAISLYERAGFERVERYNQNDHAEVFMKLNLTS